VLFDAGTRQFYLEEGRPAYYDWTSGAVGLLFELWPAESGGTPTAALARLLLSASPASGPAADRGSTRPRLRAAHVSMQGRRPTQEDRHTLMNPLEGVLCTAALFGVYDGHLGTEAANFVASELPSRLSAALGSAVSALLLAQQEPEPKQRKPERREQETQLQQQPHPADHGQDVSGITMCPQSAWNERATQRKRAGKHAFAGPEQAVDLRIGRAGCSISDAVSRRPARLLAVSITAGAPPCDGQLGRFASHSVSGSRRAGAFVEREATEEDRATLPCAGAKHKALSSTVAP
jgi:hypothetical protein